MGNVDKDYAAFAKTISAGHQFYILSMKVDNNVDPWLYYGRGDYPRSEFFSLARTGMVFHPQHRTTPRKEGYTNWFCVR